MRKRSKVILFKATAIFIGLAIGVILAECSVRYYYFGKFGFSHKYMSSFKTLSYESGLARKSNNSNIEWELVPNLDTIFKFSQFTTNSWGMRNREVKLQKNKNVTRIAVIGDSFAMGSGVKDSETFPAVLESLVNHSQKSTSFEVLNFGVGGYGLINYEAVLKNKVLQFDPDIIVIGFCGHNDHLIPDKLKLTKNEIERKRKQVLKRQSRDLFYTSYLKKEYKKARLALLKDKQNRQFADFNLKPKEQEYLKEYLGKMKVTAEKVDIPLLLAYCTVDSKPLAMKEVEDIVLNEQIHFINANKGLESKSKKELTFHKLDAHPSAYAQSVYAKNIFDYLNRNGFFSTGSKTKKP